VNQCCKISLFFVNPHVGVVGRVGINGENLFIFKYSGRHMEAGFGGLSTCSCRSKECAILWLKLKCALLPQILVHMERMVVRYGFHFRPTIRRCILTEERVDIISDLEASPRFLA
jgi:hypothetical protein